MLCLIYFEWRKTYWNPTLILVFALFLLVNVFNIFYQHQRSTYFADNDGWKRAYW